MNHSGQLGELAAALAAFRSECPAIARNDQLDATLNQPRGHPK